MVAGVTIKVSSKSEMAWMLESSGCYSIVNTRGLEAHHGTETVYGLRMVTTVLDQKGGHWLSPSRMLKYVTLKTTDVINPAMFRSTQHEESKPEHDCLQTIGEVYSSRPDLKDTPLQDPDWELYMDGSSFMKEGKRISGYAAITVETVVEAETLPSSASAQKVELISLTRALQLSKGKCINIWTDSKYAFRVVHAHGAILEKKEDYCLQKGWR